LTERENTDPETIPYYTYPGKNDDDDDARKAALSDPELLKSYGLLYNWAAATGRIDNPSTGTNELNNASQTKYRGVCPKDWHLPSDYEWTQLTDEIAANPDKYSDNTLGNGTGTRMKSTESVNNINPQGTSFSRDKGGFDALLVGNVNENGDASGYGLDTYFWSSSSTYSDGVTRYLISGNSGVGWYNSVRGELFSVRCKKN
jgi:uncharacterized protein (TIGR02145 family)